jgi:hypothetical protein
MNAFIKTEHGTFKAYRRGSDWEIVGPEFERWFSVWHNDVLGSLQRALDSVPGQERDKRILSLAD